tara:strand:- start:28 stop:201 length:174 start_codon:yes stop_codon:yes gene_type:complete
MEEIHLSEKLKDYYENNNESLNYIKSKSEIQKILKKWLSIFPLWINKGQWISSIHLI